jgi:nanoRNase/pAp phosphatase (c-di-AMP/oligoRNAs hydrolase)
MNYQIVTIEKNTLKKLVKLGKIICNIQLKEINYSVDESVEGYMLVGDTKYRVWLSNNVKYRSDVGALLCNKKFEDGTMPDFSFIWRYNISTKDWYISMRGNGSVDLSVIAQKFPDGGGHKNASGFSVKDFNEHFIIVH